MMSLVRFAATVLVAVPLGLFMLWLGLDFPGLTALAIGLGLFLHWSINDTQHRD